ncbi:MAG: hypothetical protein K2Y05_09250 [Hyphomicrobiaceae bacterium]|nr:hypothetical protein [Hyphomicrobiaceae bacterium]
MTNQDYAVWKAETEFSAHEGERWRALKARELDTLPDGTAVLINVATGEFVTGRSLQDARQTYHKTFGQTGKLAYGFTVGRPTFVGGGLG